MPGLTTTNYGGRDARWLANGHALRDARSSYGLVSSFEGEHEEGFLPSGTAVNAAVENDLKPYTGGAGEALGFLVNDVYIPVGGDEGFTAAVLRHGMIDKDHLPKPLPEGENSDTSAFVFVGGDE